MPNVNYDGSSAIKFILKQDPEAQAKISRFIDRLEVSGHVKLMKPEIVKKMS